jgi:alpha-galactosidase
MGNELISDGYKYVGFHRINIDDCWIKREREDNKKLMADPKRFANGIKYLSHYVRN